MPKNNIQLVRLVCANYRLCKSDVVAYNNGIKDFNEDDFCHKLKRVELINYIVSNLDVESRRILEHDLNGDLDDRSWYIDFYSNSTYQRYRKKAYDQFIKALKF